MKEKKDPATLEAFSLSFFFFSSSITRASRPMFESWPVSSPWFFLEERQRALGTGRTDLRTIGLATKSPELVTS